MIAPSYDERLILLKRLLTHSEISTQSIDIPLITTSSHGLTFGEIHRLYRDAKSIACHSNVSEEDGKQQQSLTQHHLQLSLQAIRQSHANKQQVIPEPIPNTSWDDIGGLEEVKTSLQEMLNPPKEAFEHFGIEAPSGILLYGPPGVGKTLLAKAVASSTSSSFISVNISAIVNGEVGESQRIIRELMKSATRASPCVVFFDEFQALFGQRGEDSGSVQRQVVSQLQLELDDCRESGADVLLMAATNRPEMIDAGFLRPGRFDRMVFIGSPDVNDRKSILVSLTSHLELDGSVNLEDIAERTELFSGADLRALVRRTVLNSLNMDRPMEGVTLTQSSFDESLKASTPSLDPSDIAKLKTWSA
eukprot:TRINITY_DN1257_c0_g1_i2.p1 TRINITY_DN1257_c0_g1~~TRINITY_DN1257_c0_g1_i2.p1  ORF type:complete len:389 (-),score=104.77 TRINITY_DN1257_c0_g1_i2:50-1135(-)